MRKRIIAGFMLAMALCIDGCGESIPVEDSIKKAEPELMEISADEILEEEISLSDIPKFAGEPFVVVNDNIPQFSEAEYSEASYEYYSDLDELGRCGVAIANLGSDLMPTEERGNIGHIKPTGWQSVQYDHVEGKSLYNRCHLIGFQLTAENDNEKNLITGTRYMNVQGMLPFENMLADYIHETDNHVLYRVTPIFEGDNLVASGVQMEAISVEDDGDGICFNVYVYNEQPGIVIDHVTGDNCLQEELTGGGNTGKAYYMLNTNTKKFHRLTCDSVVNMKKENKEEFTGNKEDLKMQGYEPCGNCKP